MEILTNKYFYGVMFSGLLLYSTAFAYTRTPVGTEITSPISVSWSLSDTDILIQAPSALSYRMSFNNSTTDYYGSCFLISDTGIHNEQFNIPVGTGITTADSYGYDNDSCSGNDNSYFSFEDAYPSFIFTIISDSNYGSVAFMSPSVAQNTNSDLGSNVATALGSGTWSYALIVLGILMTFYVLYEIKALFPQEEKRKRYNSDVARIFNEGRGSFDK